MWNLHQVKSLGWFAALVFAIACALRLARFNVSLDDPNPPAWEGHFFNRHAGPGRCRTCPAAALSQLFLPWALAPTRALAPFEIGYVLFIAFLMASRIPHFSVKKIGRIFRGEYVIVVLFAIAAVVLLLATFPMEMLACLSLGYLATIPFAVLKYKAFCGVRERGRGRQSRVEPLPRQFTNAAFSIRVRASRHEAAERDTKKCERFFRKIPL